MDLKSNKKLGNDFEKEFAQILANEGYWALLVTPKGYVNSQPMDIIATKNNIFYGFECKTLHSRYKRFSLNRLEENQRQAFKKLKKIGTNNYFLVIKYNNETIYLIPFEEIDLKQKSILLEDKYKI